MKEKLLLENRLIEFAVAIVKLIERLPKQKYLSDQLFRSGTSPALNYGEALGAESRSDFAHKISITLKDLRESYNSLRILSSLGHISPNDPAIKECDELISIFVKTINTLRSQERQDKLT